MQSPRSSAVVLFVMVVGCLLAMTTLLLGTGADPDATRPTADSMQPADAPSSDTAMRVERVEANAPTEAAPGLARGAAESAAAGPGAAYRGRIVFEGGLPATGCGIRLYCLGESPENATNIMQRDRGPTSVDRIAVAAVTDAEGVWQIPVAHPGEPYLLVYGVGTASAIQSLVPRTPARAEIVDLGDLGLPAHTEVAGRVVDGNGAPIAGAQVLSCRLPAGVPARWHLASFDLAGALVMRSPGGGEVLAFPAWLRRLLADLPVPSARSGVDGRFLLRGVATGGTSILALHEGYVTHLDDSLEIAAGERREMPPIVLQQGVRLHGRVFDAQGRPVIGAQVMAGSTAPFGQFDCVRPCGPSDTSGRFSATGFPTDRVTLAVRRHAFGPWLVQQVQCADGEAQVVLPSSGTLSLTIRDSEGRPAAVATFEVLQGQDPGLALERRRLGMAASCALPANTTDVAPGKWRIENLPPGFYCVLAQAPGQGLSTATIDLHAGAADCDITLPARRSLTVVVRDGQDHPVAQAVVSTAGPLGAASGTSGSIAGRTDAEGRLIVDVAVDGTQWVSAEHPDLGCTQGVGAADEEVSLRLPSPGSLRGTVVGNAGAIPADHLAIECRAEAAEPFGNSLGRTSRLIPVGQDGRFAVSAMPAGIYYLRACNRNQQIDLAQAFAGLGAADTPGDSTHECRVEICSGNEAQVQIDLTSANAPGATARVSGQASVDGRPACNHAVRIFAGEQSRTVRCDAHGTFDFGAVAIGPAVVQLLDRAQRGGAEPEFTLDSRELQLEAGATATVAFEARTSSLAGTCRTNGKPLVGASVQAIGRLASGPGMHFETFVSAQTDGEGGYRFERLPAGSWTVMVEGDDEPHSVGRSREAALAPGDALHGFDIEVASCVPVTGHVDLSWTGPASIGSVQANLRRIARVATEGQVPEHGDSVAITLPGGHFATERLVPGRYRVTLHVDYEDGQEADADCGTVDVPEVGGANLVVKPSGSKPPAMPTSAVGSPERAR